MALEKVLALLVLLACGDDSAPAGGSGGSGSAMTSTGGSGGGEAGAEPSGAGATGGMAGECTIPVDCPLPTSECIIRTCVDAVCGQELAVPGSILAQQTPGDCQRNICDAAGDVAQEPDDADLPSDDNECTADLCADGAPAFDPVADGTPCTEGTCAAGQCL